MTKQQEIEYFLNTKQWAEYFRAIEQDIKLVASKHDVREQD